jgi:hypothetical protein
MYQTKQTSALVLRIVNVILTLNKHFVAVMLAMNAPLVDAQILALATMMQTQV